MKISIDLWGTLIKGSPLFQETKVSLVKEVFGEIENNKIITAFETTKKSYNSVIEISGMSFPRVQIFSALHFFLYEKKACSKDLLKFMNEYDTLALTYMPQIYSGETLEYLEKLKEFTSDLILSSNTLMLSSNTLIQVLDALELSKHFTDVFFSDAVGVSKPHIAMYDQSNYHIGDNYTTDFVGALNAGSQGFLINSNDKTLKDAYDFIISTEGV